MTFSYNLAATDATEKAIAEIRLHIGDTIYENGPQPSGNNFTDEELAHFYETEETPGRAAALALETLANQWAGVPRTMFGALIDPRTNATHYRNSAKAMREQHGYSNKGGAIVVQVEVYGAG